MVAQQVRALDVNLGARVRIPPTQHYYLHIFSPDDESCSGFLLPKTLIFYPLCFRVKIFSKYIGNCLHGINTGCIFDPSITQKRKKMSTAITLTAEYKKRIVSAISETERLLAKEEKYSFDLRNHEQVASYKKHLLFLSGLLTKESFVPNFSN